MYWGLAANLSSKHFSLTCTNFEGVIGSCLYSFKLFLPAEQFFGNSVASWLGSKVNETGIWPSPGAMLTISLGEMFDPSTLYIIAGKGLEDSFNSLF